MGGGGRVRSEICTTVLTLIMWESKKIYTSDGNFFFNLSKLTSSTKTNYTAGKNPMQAQELTPICYCIGSPWHVGTHVVLANLSA